MKKFKFLLLGVVIGLAVGLWFGVNIGRNKPIFSNPFAAKSIKEKAKETASDVLDETKRALRKSLEE